MRAEDVPDVDEALADVRRAAAHYRRQKFGGAAKAWEQFNVALDRLLKASEAAAIRAMGDADE